MLGSLEQLVCDAAAMPLGENRHPSQMTFVGFSRNAGNCSQHMVGIINSNQDTHALHSLLQGSVG